MILGGSDIITCILTTCKRSPEVFLRALKSILNQTYTDIEIIVINDAPNYIHNSEIRGMIEYYKVRVSFPIYYFENENNKGANYSRNRGIYYSRGEFIAFLDDDDEWLQDKLSTEISLFDDSEVGLVYSDYYRITLNKERIHVYKAHRNDIVLNELLAHNIIGPTSGVIVRKSCLRKSGLFDDSLPARQDYDLWLRISQHYKVSHVRDFLFIYHDSDLSISNNINKRITGREMVLNKYHYLYVSNSQAYKYSLFEYYTELLDNRKYIRALKLMLMIFHRIKPTLVERKNIISFFLLSIINKKIDYPEYY